MCSNTLLYNLTIYFVPMNSPSFWSIDPTTLRHLLADIILATDRPVNLAISLSSGYFPLLVLSAFRAFCTWLIALLKVHCNQKNSKNNGYRWDFVLSRNIQWNTIHKVKKAYRNSDSSCVFCHQGRHRLPNPILDIGWEFVSPWLIEPFCTLQHTYISCL